MIKLIMFDLDDTLVNHKAGAEAALKAVIDLMARADYIPATYDCKPFVDAYYKKNHRLWEEFTAGRIAIDKLLEDRFDYISDWFETDEKIKEELKKCYWDSYTANCPLTADWIPLLKELRNHLSLAICSNGAQEVQIRKLECNNIIGFFDGLYFGTRQPECKPFENFFRGILDDFKLKSEEVLMVGDSLDNDITPCSEMGMQVLLYKSDSPYEKIKQCIMDMIGIRNVTI